MAESRSSVEPPAEHRLLQSTRIVSRRVQTAPENRFGRSGIFTHVSRRPSAPTWGVFSVQSSFKRANRCSFIHGSLPETRQAARQEECDRSQVKEDAVAGRTFRRCVRAVCVLIFGASVGK